MIKAIWGRESLCGLLVPELESMMAEQRHAQWLHQQAERFHLEPQLGS